MRQPEMSKIGCLWVENGKPCERPLIGTAWKFCPKHGPLAKLARQREDSRNFREDNSEQYKLIEYRYNHGLTKSQLEPLVVRAEAQREQYPRFMDEFFEQTITRINEIQQTLLYPPADFDSAFVAAEIQANDLLAKLKGKHYSRPSLVTNRLLICVMELLRDIAHPLSPEAFRTIRKYARQVQMRCKEEGDLLKLALSLLVDVEFARLHFLDNPDQVNVLTGADRSLDAAKHVCDLALDRYKGDQKRIAHFLRFYVDLGVLRLAFDVGVQEQARLHIQNVHQRATAVMQAYGYGGVFAVTKFLSALAHAEYDLRFNQRKFAECHLTDAEDAFNMMKSPSIEAHRSLASVNARVSLLTGDQNRHEELQKYIELCQYYPSLEHSGQLRELRRVYPEDVAEDCIPKRDGVLVDTTFRHIQPFLRWE